MNIYFYVFILLHRFLCGVAYREFTQLVHGFLGGKRILLPACVYHAIRTELSEENEEFVGFEDNESRYCLHDHHYFKMQTAKQSPFTNFILVWTNIDSKHQPIAQKLSVS